jgi:hypothetical protein
VKEEKLAFESYHNARNELISAAHAASEIDEQLRQINIVT